MVTFVSAEEFNESGELYANGKPAMHWISSVPNEITDWTVANNAYVVTSAVEDFYAAFGDGNGDDGNPDNGTDGDNDIIGAGAPLTDHILSRISNANDAFTEFDFDLTNAPAAPIDMVTWYRTETGRTKETITFDAATDDYDRRDMTYFLDDFNPSYATTEAAYTAAAGSCPVGDLNWFPDVFDACDAIAIDTEVDPGQLAFGLGNGPNPFSASTTIRYSLAEAADVTLSVYDALGRELAQVASGAQPAGDHTASWSADGMAAGVYLVRLQANDAVAMHRMMVVR